jgi:hypothetical protein
MVDLNGHEAGNGGYSQGKPTAYRDSSTRRDGDFTPTTFLFRRGPLPAALIRQGCSFIAETDVAYPLSQQSAYKEKGPRHELKRSPGGAVY